MQKTKSIVGWILVLLLGVAGVAGAADLTLLSGNGSEERILAQAAKILLEKQLGLKVKHIPHFNAAVLMHSALLSGDAQGYTSYTGTQFTGVLQQEVTGEWKDRQKILDYVTEQFRERYEAIWLPPFGFNNSYVVAVRREFAEEHDLQTMSDLQAVAPHMTLAMDVTFRDRPGDGYEAMNEVYGLAWQRPVAMDYGLIYRATASSDVDAAVAYSTDGRIAALDLVALEDDLQFFPPYDCSLILRRDVLEQYPEIREVLAPLIGRIDEAMMSRYNQLVDVEQQEFEDVAQLLVDELTK